MRQLLTKGANVVASNVSGSSRHLEDVQSQVKITRADIACFTDALRLVGAHKPETIYRGEVHAGERKPYKNVVNGELLPCHRFGESKYQFVGTVYELNDFPSL